MIRFLLFMTAAAGLLGCPGRLEDPERFQTQNATFSCTSGADPVEDIINPKCQAACHNTSAKLGGLDLTAAGLSARLVGVAAAECANQVLVRTDGQESYLINKVKAQAPACGTVMPQGAALSAAEVTCLEEWVAHLAEEAT